MARRIIVQPQSALDIQATTVWYEDQQSGLGARFLGELNLAVQRIENNPRQFSVVVGQVRRALLQHFPYGIYFNTSLTGSISSLNRKLSQFWQSCTCTVTLMCGRAACDGSAE